LKPLISLYVGDYEPVMYLDWQSLELNVTNPDGVQETLNTSSFIPGEAYVSANSTNAEIEYQYFDGKSQSTLYVYELLTYASAYLTLKYEFTNPSNFSLSSVIGHFSLTAPTRFGSYSDSVDSLALQDKFGKWHNVTLSFFSNDSPSPVELANSTITSPYVVTKSSELPFLSFNIQSQGHKSISEFSFGIQVGSLPNNFIEPDAYDFNGIQKILGFDYVLVLNSNSDRNMYTGILQWIELTFVRNVGKLVYENSAAYIFQIPDNSQAD